MFMASLALFLGTDMNKLSGDFYENSLGPHDPSIHPVMFSPWFFHDLWIPVAMTGGMTTPGAEQTKRCLSITKAHAFRISKLSSGWEGATERAWGTQEFPRHSL